MAERGRAIVLWTVAVALAGCTLDASATLDAQAPAPDMRPPDLDFAPRPDLAVVPDDGPHNACGDTNPTCEAYVVGPPFALQGDPQPNPLELDTNLKRDQAGALVIDGASLPPFDKLWLATPAGLSVDGSVSKLDQGSVREVARYRTVTCYSRRGGSTAACDGTTGCCSLDDWQRYQARKTMMTQPGHEPVQRTVNLPSATAVDWSGDAFVANRGEQGQSSVTKIAGDRSRCLDRNRNGRLDTSEDTDGNGIIDVDCNGNAVWDNLDDVGKKPCTNGLAQEFYGEDDECLLWTTNTFATRATGRALALAAADFRSTSVWAGSGGYGQFVRLSGATGLTMDDVQLPQQCYPGTGPYSAVVDRAGILWSAELGAGRLCYFDTANSKNVGSARDPQWGAATAVGVAVDRDLDIWVGGDVARYTPDRSNGFKNLGNGWWTRIEALHGAGIAADVRASPDHFVWSCRNNDTLVGIRASALPRRKQDVMVPLDDHWPVIHAPCYGVGVDSDQNLWAVPQGEYTTRASVDGSGKVTQPDVGGPTVGDNFCPAGDSCALGGVDTISDFTGYGLRNLTSPLSGGYSVVLNSHCLDRPGAPDTLWRRIEWQADLPAGTAITVRYLAGYAPPTNLAWITSAIGYTSSPIDLGPGDTGGSLRLYIQLSTLDPAVTARLLGLTAHAECIGG